MVSLRVGATQLCKLRKHASELEQSGGRRGGAEVEGVRGLGREGEGRSYHDIIPEIFEPLNEDVVPWMQW